MGRLTSDAKRRLAYLRPEPPQVDTGTTSHRRSAPRQSTTRSVGWDVHQDAMAVASVAQAHGAAVTFRGTMGTRPWALDHLLRQRHAKATPLLVVDAAGPCGSWLSRDRMN